MTNPEANELGAQAAAQQAEKHNHAFSRRSFLKGLGATALGAAALNLVGCGSASAGEVKPQGRAVEIAADNTPANGPEQIKTELTPINTPEATLTPEVKKEPHTIREYADQLNIKMGTYLVPRVFPTNKEWQNIASNQFNLAVNSIFWTLLLQNSDGSINFNLPDNQTDFAIKNKMDVRGEALVFPYYVPDWIKKDETIKGQQLQDLMLKTINATMDHYKGKIKTWVVLNEAGVVPPYSNNDFFTKRMGSDYYISAFQAARDNDPTAKLIYNDFNCDTLQGAKYKNAKTIVENLQKKGLIDAVGLEMHVDASKVPSKDDLVQGMQSYGLPIHITELDVDLRNITGTQDERFALQAQIYKQIIEAALESKVCENITFWGFGDKYSWLEQTEFNGASNADPTLYDDNLQPKPAYYATIDALKNIASHK